jgi:O-antigen ligase
LIAASLPWEDKYKVIRTIVFAGFIISILAIYQYFFGFSHLSEYVAKNKITDQFVLDYIERKRIFYPFITPNTLAGYFIIVIPLIFIIKDKQKWLMLLVIISALMLTKSIGALLSLFLGACLYIYLKKRVSRKKIAVLGVLLGICILIFILRQTATKGHFLFSFSVAKRLGYWHQTLKIIKAHPFKGLGLGMFNLYSSRYAHNSYLQLWAETGILGLASFLWLVGVNLYLPSVVLAKEGVRHLHNGQTHRSAPTFIVAVVIFLLHNLVDFTLFLPEVSFIWWVILGILGSDLKIKVNFSSYAFLANPITRLSLTNPNL